MSSNEALLQMKVEVQEFRLVHFTRVTCGCPEVVSAASLQVLIPGIIRAVST